MNFDDFLRWKSLAKLARPGLVDRSETRIARAFGDLRPPVQLPGAFKMLHRCDLAKTWCDARGLPREFARRALVCEGVRHALRLILRALAAQGTRVAIPRDVYPVYAQIAAATGAATLELDTFPSLDLERLLDACVAEGVRNLLLPSPLKLHGRRWTAAEGSAAAAWLRRDPARRLMLDGVYSFGSALDAPTLDLIATDQVLYLDSLSKGWLHEETFGAAIVPTSDLGFYEGAFVASRPQQEHLYVAHEMLTTHRAFPAELRSAIDRQREELLRFTERAGLAARPTSHGYLVIVEKSADEVLEQHDLLTIPVSVFGSTAPGFCVASALPAPRDS